MKVLQRPRERHFRLEAWPTLSPVTEMCYMHMIEVKIKNSIIEVLNTPCSFVMHRPIILNFKERDLGSMVGPQAQL